MTAPLPNSWANRDLPFLIEIARRIDAGEDFIRVTSDDDIAAARALIPTYLVGEVRHSAQGINGVHITDITDAGRRASGLWPVH